MKRDDHYAEAERLLNNVSQISPRIGLMSDDVPTLLAALTHAVLASVDDNVADPIPWT
jgi:hypothetical protein